MTTAPGKGPDAYRTISEASAELGVPAHMLRFWETKFSFVRPMKRAGGRRFYRPQDLDVLRGVRALLQEDGYTIKGVQRLHKEGGVRRLVAASGVKGEAAEALAQALEALPADEAPSDDGAAAAPVAPKVARREGVEFIDLLSAAAAPPEPAEPPPARHVLDAAARARLEGVLADLEQVKGAIDHLLAAGSDS